MKNIPLLLIVTFIFLAGCATTTEPAAEKASAASQKVDVKSIVDSYDYKVLSKIDEGKMPKYVLAVIGEAEMIDDARIDVGEILQSEINRSGRVTLVDRGNLESIIEEQKFALSGLSEEGSVRIGELAGADYLIVTELVSSSRQKVDKVVYDVMEVEVTVQVKLLDVSTGEVFKSETSLGESSAKLVTDSDGNLISGALDYSTLYARAALDAVEDIIPPFIEQFPLLGFVLKKGDNSVECDLGSDSGVVERDRVAFIRKGEPVRHPVTDQLVSYDYTYLGYGIVEVVKSSSSTVRLTDILEPTKVTDIAVYIGE